MGYNHTTLEFKDHNLEKKYYRLSIKRNLNFIRIIFLFYFLSYLLFFIYESLTLSKDRDKFLIQRSPAICILLVFMILSASEKMKKFFKYITLLVKKKLNTLFVYFFLIFLYFIKIFSSSLQSVYGKLFLILSTPNPT